MSAPTLSEIAAVLGSIAESSPLAIAATEGETHLVRYANPAFCRLAPRPQEGIIGRPLADALPKPHVQAALSLMNRVFESSEGGAVKLGARRGSRGATTVTYTAWPVTGGSSRFSGLLVQISDTAEHILERDRATLASNEILAANQQLLIAGLKAQEHADTQESRSTTLRNLVAERDHALARAAAALRERDDFLAVASHELRAPLTALKGYAQLARKSLRSDVTSSARAARYLERMETSTDRLDKLLADLMDVSRLGTGELAVHRVPMDLAALVQSIALRYAETAGAGHHMITNVPGNPIRIDGDEVRIEQLVDNLLSNAIKYTPKGGEIKVHLAVRPRQACDERGRVVLTVTDTGIGFPAGDSQRIFEPFSRATNASQQGATGLGLGLHICGRIVEAHGGNMSGESQGVGLGTTMRVWLPL